MNEAKNRKYGAALSVANMVISIVIGAVYTPAVLRFLGQGEYGVYTLSLSLVAYLNLLDMGFGNTLIRFSARARAENKPEKDIYGMFLILYTAAAALAFSVGLCMYFNIGSFFSASFTAAETVQLKTLFFIMLINTTLVFPNSVFSAIIRSNQRFVFANVLSLIMNVGRHAVTVLFLFVGGRTVSMALTALGVTALTLVSNIYFCFAKIRVRFGFGRFEKKFYREVFGYSFFILLNIAADQLFAGTDKVILGRICGSSAVAVYGVAVTFQTYFSEFSNSVSGVFLPHITQLAAKENGAGEMSLLFARVGRVQFIMLSYILLGFVTYGREFVALWAGEGYGDAYLIAVIIMASSLIPLSQNIGVAVLQAYGKHGYRSVLYLVIAALNAAISVPLAAAFGGVGAAAGTAAASILGETALMNLFYSKKMGLDVSAYWRQTGIYAVKMLPVAMVFFASALVTGGEGWKPLVLKAACGTTASLPYVFFVILTKEERRAVLSRLGLAKIKVIK